MSDPPVAPPLDELDEQPDDGPATRELIAARKRRLAAQAEDPPRGSNIDRDRRHDAYWLDT